jgi:hypothetical protein
MAVTLFPGDTGSSCACAVVVASPHNNRSTAMAACMKRKATREALKAMHPARTLKIALTSLRQMASKQADRRHAALNAARQNGVASASECGAAALLVACFLFAARRVRTSVSVLYINFPFRSESNKL